MEDISCRVSISLKLSYTSILKARYVWKNHIVNDIAVPCKIFPSRMRFLHDLSTLQPSRRAVLSQEDIRQCTLGPKVMTKTYVFYFMNHLLTAHARTYKQLYIHSPCSIKQSGH